MERQEGVYRPAQQEPETIEITSVEVDVPEEAPTRRENLPPNPIPEKTPIETPAEPVAPVPQRETVPAQR